MLEFVVKDLDMYPIINLTEAVMKEGIILKFEGGMPKESNAHLRIYVKSEAEIRAQEAKDSEILPTIPGHPNCHYGDCLKECHVVSCAIYQGLEEIPTLPEYDDDTVQ